MFLTTNRSFDNNIRQPGSANANDDTTATANTDDSTNDDDDDDSFHQRGTSPRRSDGYPEFFLRGHDRNAVWQELERRRQPPALRRPIYCWCVLVVAFMWMDRTNIDTIRSTTRHCNGRTAATPLGWTSGSSSSADEQQPQRPTVAGRQPTSNCQFGVGVCNP